VPAEKLRWAVGSIVAEGDEKPDDELVKVFEQHGFKLFNLPAVSKVVKTTFPHKTFLSVYIYVYRVYSAVGKYEQVSIMSHLVEVILNVVNFYILMIHIFSFVCIYMILLYLWWNCGKKDMKDSDFSERMCKFGANAVGGSRKHRLTEVLENGH